MDDFNGYLSWRLRPAKAGSRPSAVRRLRALLRAACPPPPNILSAQEMAMLKPARRRAQQRQRAFKLAASLRGAAPADPLPPLTPLKPIRDVEAELARCIFSLALSFLIACLERPEHGR